jgi:peptidoglycan/LPS O-acetylase OafA/YrhL
MAAAPRGGPEPPSYRRDIDGLRAVAVLAVLGYHAFPERIPGGFAGVDVFFVISGFLITGILLGTLERGTFSLRGFYARRVRRIFPALIVVLAACWIFGWFALFPDEYRQLGRHVAAGAGFVSNFYFWGEAGYFDNAAETKPLLHLWSLGIEEQFYIVWPLLLAWAWRREAKISRWLAALAAVSFTVNVLGLERYPTATFYSPAGRAWELALGGILATIGATRYGLAEAAGTARAAKYRNLLAGAGVVLLALALTLLAEGKSFPGWWAALPTLGAAALLAAGPHTFVNRLLLANRPMVWIGLISYPLYLWHWPLLSFARIVESKQPATGFRVAALGASFVLAALTYWVIEKPFRFGGRARWKIVTLAVAMTVVAAAGRVTAWQRGLPDRSTLDIEAGHQRALQVPDDAARAAECQRRFGFDESFEFCLLDRVEAPPTVALVGDSHAHHFVVGLSAAYRERGENLLYLATRIPFWGVRVQPGDDYQAVTPRMLDIALESPTVQTVLLATALDLEVRTPRGRSMNERMAATIQRFVDRGKRVIWIEDVPALDFEPRECLSRLAIPTSKTKWPCAMSRRTVERAKAQSAAVLGALRARIPELELLETTKHLCDATSCWAMREGKLLYRDKDHLSDDGDRFLGARIGPELGAPGPLRSIRLESGAPSR